MTHMAHFVDSLQYLQHCKYEGTVIVHMWTVVTTCSFPLFLLMTKTVITVHSRNTSDHNLQAIVQFTSF